MPVSEVNAVRMGYDTTNLFNTGEAVTEFWAVNAEMIAWVLIFFVLVILVIIGTLGIRFLFEQIAKLVNR